MLERPTPHNLLENAITDFSSIDTSHSGKLNLVDIAAYEKNGDHQKQVGQFLERNINILSGLNTDEKAHGYVDITDLRQAVLFTSDEKKKISDAQNKAANRAAGPIETTLGLGSIAAAGTIAAFTGPETLLVTAPIAVVGTTIATVAAYHDEMTKQRAMQAKTEKIK